MYVSGSTAAVPGTVKSGQIVTHYTGNANGVLYWQKATTRTGPYKIVYLDPNRRYGGNFGSMYYGAPFNESGLAVPAFTAFDYDTTNGMLGLVEGYELLAGNEFTVDTDGYVSTSNFTVGGKLFVSSTPGKLEQDDSPSAGDLSVGYVKVTPAQDNGNLTYVCDPKVTIS